MKPGGSRQRSEGCLAATARRATCRRYRSGSWISASENESSMNCHFLHSPCQVRHIYSVSRRTWLSLVGVLFVLLWVLSTQFPFPVSGTKSCAFRPRFGEQVQGAVLMMPECPRPLESWHGCSVGTMMLPPRKPGAAELEKVAEGLLRRGTSLSNWLLSILEAWWGS